jgi:hypothetical protein
MSVSGRKKVRPAKKHNYDCRISYPFGGRRQLFPPGGILSVLSKSNFFFSPENEEISDELVRPLK